MALYVASHYRNSPDDLQLMADDPNHHLFVLLGKPVLIYKGNKMIRIKLMFVLRKELQFSY